MPLYLISQNNNSIKENERTWQVIISRFMMHKNWCAKSKFRTKGLYTVITLLICKNARIVKYEISHVKKYQIIIWMAWVSANALYYHATLLICVQLDGLFNLLKSKPCGNSDCNNNEISISFKICKIVLGHYSDIMLLSLF